MIAVLDTNIVASATYWRGKPAHCLEAWILGKYDIAISHPILTEYEDVIARLAAHADYLVTGDKAHLLTLKQAGGVPIIAASDFLSFLGVPENPADA